jgi:hypothetical protein
MAALRGDISFRYLKVKQRSLWYETHKNIYVLLLKEVGNIGIHLGWRKGFDIFWKGDKAGSWVIIVF